MEEVAVDKQALIEDSPSLEENDYAQLDDPILEPEPISYNGTDFDVEGLVRRLQRKDIVVPTFGHGDVTVETAGFHYRMTESFVAFVNAS